MTSSSHPFPRVFIILKCFSIEAMVLSILKNEHCKLIISRPDRHLIAFRASIGPIISSNTSLYLANVLSSILLGCTLDLLELVYSSTSKGC